MYNINLLEVKEFIIKVDSEIWKTKLTGIDEKKISRSGDEIFGELVFEILRGRSTGSGILNKRCEVYFNIGNAKYFFEGRSFSAGNKIIVMKQSEIYEDRRAEIRLDTPLLPAVIKEKGVFRPKNINANVLNLSSKGAKIATDIQLDLNAKYIIETILDRRNFSAIFKIMYMEEREKGYAYGIMFEEIGEKEQKHLKEYLSELKGEEFSDYYKFF